MSSEDALKLFFYAVAIYIGYTIGGLLCHM